MESTMRASPVPAADAEAQTLATLERRKPEISLVESPPPGVKARQLLQEARRASVEHVAALEQAILTARKLSDTVVEAGDLYAPGLHAFATRLSEELFWRSKSLAALAERQRALAG